MYLMMCGCDSEESIAFYWEGGQVIGLPFPAVLSRWRIPAISGGGTLLERHSVLPFIKRPSPTIALPLRQFYYRGRSSSDRGHFCVSFHEQEQSVKTDRNRFVEETDDSSCIS